MNDQNLSTTVVTHPLAPIVEKVGIPVFWMVMGAVVYHMARRKL